MPRVGVVGSIVWDEIHGLPPRNQPVQEWGGIAYALGALDAALDEGWEIVPLIRVGADLAPRAADFLRSLRRVDRRSRLITVPEPTHRVLLAYHPTSGERLTEQISGGVPPWQAEQLLPLTADLDALYLNFIAGNEMTLETALMLRQGFPGPIYADLHSLTLGRAADGSRFGQVLPDVPGWLSAFDLIQCNEEEYLRLGEHPSALAATALGAGVSLLLITLGAAGAVYFARPGFELLSSVRTDSTGSAVRTAQVPAPPVQAIDTTGCGDVFGATIFGRLLAGDDLDSALNSAHRAAARNATLRGASGLSELLRGNLVRT